MENMIQTTQRSCMKELEIGHEELWEQASERYEGVKMQQKVLKGLVGEKEGMGLEAILAPVLERKRQLNLLHDEGLLRSRIRLQEQSQLERVVVQLEERIREMRLILHEKEIQIAHEHTSKSKRQLPTRHNIEFFDEEQMHLYKLQHYQHVRKDLTHIIDKKMKNIPECSIIPQNFQQKQLEPQFQPESPTLKKNTRFFGFLRKQQSPLLQKLLKLLSLEVSRERELKKQRQNLLQKWRDVKQQSISLIKQYKSLCKQKVNF